MTDEMIADILKKTFTRISFPIFNREVDEHALDCNGGARNSLRGSLMNLWNWSNAFGGFDPAS